MITMIEFNSGKLSVHIIANGFAVHEPGTTTQDARFTVSNAWFQTEDECIHHLIERGVEPYHAEAVRRMFGRIPFKPL